MKTIRNLTCLFLVIAISACGSNTIKNEKTETAVVYGNCSMCQKTIETAGDVKNVSEVVWDKDTKIATLRYDSTKTSKDEILQRIAQAGYDNELYRSSDLTYDNLPKCCHYDRPSTSEMPGDSTQAENAIPATDTAAEAIETTEEPQASTPEKKISDFNEVLSGYFALNTALVSSDAKTAAAKAKKLVEDINKVDPSTLTPELQKAWDKQSKQLKSNAQAIAQTGDLKTQRAKYLPLSDGMYQLAKVAKYKAPVYYQYCPMANDGKGAHWLSTDKQVNNPYYGDEMLHCGNTEETIN